MTWYAYDKDGWYTGEVPDDSPNATSVMPPILETDKPPGAPRSVWCRVEWRVVAVAIPLMSKEEIRAAIWSKIKTIRDLKLDDGGYLAGGKWFHSDARSRNQQLGLLQQGDSLPAGIMWKTMDGTFIEMTPALAKAILAAAMTSDIALHTYAEILKAQVWAAADPASVNIHQGWPTTFQG